MGRECNLLAPQNGFLRIFVGTMFCPIVNTSFQVRKTLAQFMHEKKTDDHTLGFAHTFRSQHGYLISNDTKITLSLK